MIINGLQLYWLPTVFIPPLEDIYSNVRECREREGGREGGSEGGRERRREGTKEGGRGRGGVL